MNSTITPGWKTSEFWLALLPQVPIVLGMFAGAANPLTLGIGAACIVAYNLSRAYVKGQTSQAAAAALQAAAQATTAPAVK